MERRVPCPLLCSPPHQNISSKRAGFFSALFIVIVLIWRGSDKATPKLSSWPAQSQDCIFWSVVSPCIKSHSWHGSAVNVDRVDTLPALCPEEQEECHVNAKACFSHWKHTRASERPGKGSVFQSPMSPSGSPELPHWHALSPLRYNSANFLTCILLLPYNAFIELRLNNRSAQA